MSTTVTVTGLEKLRDRLIRAGNVAIYKAAVEVQNEARYLVNKGGDGRHSNPGNPPNLQTGDLMKSIQVKGPDELGIPLRAKVGSTAPQGRWMEYGVPLITAKRTRFLPVPINLAAQRMLRKVAGVGLRTQKLKVVKKDNLAYLMEMTPTGSKVKKGGAVFVLKRSITIKPRPWLMPAIKLSRDAMLAKFRDTFAQEWGRA